MRKHFIIQALLLILTLPAYAEKKSDSWVMPDGGNVSKKELAQGRVTYSDGKPAAGIAVSDGFQIVTTDSDGKYSLKPHKDTWYIYITLPADAKITMNTDGRPDFFKKYNASKHEYDFTLQRQAVEQRFNIFAIGDIHYTEKSSAMFKAQILPGFKSAYSKFNDLPGYGLFLGDLVNNTNSWNTKEKMPEVAPLLREIPFPLFMTMGNHDFTYYNSKNPLTPDERSSTVEIKFQRDFEDLFGPINYSFNRGRVHFVAMRDEMPEKGSSHSGDIDYGVSDEQREWLRQDLALLPEGTKVILAVHIPLPDSETEIPAMISKFNGEIFAAHTHTKKYNDTYEGGVRGHVHCSTINTQTNEVNLCGDGSPKGITVYTFAGNNMVDEHFIGLAEKMNDKDYQMRVYRGGLKYGGKYAYFQTDASPSDIFINVFNGDKRWKSVEVYENGVKTGNATLMESGSVYRPSPLEAGKTYSIPSSKNSQDWWAQGFIKGVFGYKVDSGSNYAACTHMYKYTLKNPSATVKVVATDPYGNVYTCTEVITDGTDYPSYLGIF